VDITIVQASGLETERVCGYLTPMTPLILRLQALSPGSPQVILAFVRGVHVGMIAPELRIGFLDGKQLSKLAPMMDPAGKSEIAATYHSSTETTSGTVKLNATVVPPDPQDQPEPASAACQPKRFKAGRAIGIDVWI